MAGSTIYASNDQVHWNRITSGITDFTDGMSEIEVDPAYRNTQFRFIKIQMINPQPDVLSGKVQNLMEWVSSGLMVSDMKPTTKCHWFL
ncbi:hypothetical protein [Paenibacillus antibioticophila]|nr:hypothetical protein [Paenibacillus antibioticophila]